MDDALTRPLIHEEARALFFVSEAEFFDPDDLRKSTVVKTKGAVARKMGVSVTTVTNWIDKGLPCRKNGRGYVFDLLLTYYWRLGRQSAEAMGVNISSSVMAVCFGYAGTMCLDDEGWRAPAHIWDRYGEPLLGVSRDSFLETYWRCVALWWRGKELPDHHWRVTSGLDPSG